MKKAFLFSEVSANSSWPGTEKVVSVPNKMLAFSWHLT